MAEGEGIAAQGGEETTSVTAIQPACDPSNPSLESTKAAGQRTRIVAALRKAFSFHTLLAAFLVAAVIGSVLLNLQQAASPAPGNPQFSIFEGDTWWHLAVGQHILATHALPTQDHYSFTAPGNGWIAYEWLGDVAIAAAGRAAGLTGLALLFISLAALLILLMYYYAYSRSGSGKAAFVACAAMLPLMVISFTLRPQLIGYILLLITLISLERFRQGKLKQLWFLPVVFLLWVNTHGTFAFGMAVLFLYWISGLSAAQIGSLRAEAWTERQRRHLGVVTLLSLLALTVTPYGTQLAAYPLQMAFFQPVNIASFEEWRPPDFSGPYGKLFLGMILLIVVVHLAGWVQYRLEEMGLLMFGIWSACLHMRFVIVFAMIFAPLLALMVARFMPPYDARKDKFLLNAALIAAIIAGCARFFPSRSQLERVVEHGFPVQAAHYIRRHPSVGPVFNKEFWGGYLIWKLDPQQKVFIDGRADLYESAGVLTDYLQVMRLNKDAMFLLQKYNVRSCLIEPNSPLAVYLTASPGWDRVYSDNLSALFVRKKEAALRKSTAN